MSKLIKTNQKMKDFAADVFPDPERQKTKVFIPGYDTGESAATKTEQITLPDRDAWDEEDRQISEYNARVFDIDPDYAAFEPNRFMIVRCFHKRYQRSASGLIESEPRMYVPEKTMNGLGNLATVATPWCFQNVGVVIAVPPVCGFKVGDILHLDPAVVTPSPKQKLADWALPQAFMLFSHQDWHLPPTSKESKHFGYFFASEHNSVLGKISRELFDKLMQSS